MKLKYIRRNNFLKNYINLYYLKFAIDNQSLIGLVVIDAELDRGTAIRTPTTAIDRGLEPLDVITDLRTRLNWW
jgi:hypothetical protein